MSGHRVVSKLAAVVAAVVVCATARSSFADIVYQSGYFSDDGTINEPNVQISLNVAAGTGTYTLPDGSQGTLNFHIGNGPIPNKTYQGTWSFFGDSGTFRWTVTGNGAQFNGTWTDQTTGATGQWSGHRGNGPVSP